MDRLIVALVVIGLVVAFVVYVVLPILGILLAIGLLIAGGIAFAGFISGVFLGIKNFFEVLQEAHKKLI